MLTLDKRNIGNVWTLVVPEGAPQKYFECTKGAGEVTVVATTTTPVQNNPAHRLVSSDLTSKSDFNWDGVGDVYARSTSGSTTMTIVYS